MKKRLFVMSHGLASVGIDIFVVNIATHFDREKFDVSVVLALDEGGAKQPREDEVRSAGIPIRYTCDLGSVKRIVTHFLRLYRILRKEQVDIFHSNMGLMDGINCLAALLAGVPVRVTHSHTTDSHYAAKTGRQLIAAFFRWAMRLLCGLTANRRCGCSEPAMVYMFGEHWKKKRHTCVINNGIDLQRFHPDGAKAQNDTKRIISVGRLANEKNPLFALDVMAELRKLRQDFVYEWVGTGEMREQVAAAIREKGLEAYVRLLGARNDIEKLLPQRDLFFMPSKFEGLGIALIEAQAAGLPCVGSDQIPELANCGGCAFLPLDAAASDWAKAISDILDGKHSLSVDPEKLHKFDIGYTVEQLEQIYNG